MKKQLVSTLFFLIFGMFSFGQGNSYDDVGVIVNDNSQVSINIANYFKQARNIPDENMIHIHTVVDEAIDTTEFRNIQYQIKNYIAQQNLQYKLNYLVTTKGVPFDIEVDSCIVHPPPSTFYRCSSVESELCLLFSADSSKITKSSFVQNPFYGSTNHISNTDTDLLLVTRLDGNTPEDVYNLIDRSGPGSYVDKQQGQFIFDISYEPETSSTFNYFAGMMYTAIDTLTNKGWNTQFHGDTLVPSNEDHVIGYVGFIRRSYNSSLNFSWEKGAFCEFMVSGPEFTFYDSLNVNDNIQLADVVFEGCTSGSGYVHATFGSQLTDYAIFFSRYTNEGANSYNLAESYYMATKALSWMNILVGDPKTTITTLGAGSVESVQAIQSLQLYPNPAKHFVNLALNAETSSIISISVFDQMGKLWQSEEKFLNSGRNDLEVSIDKLPTGLYFLQVIDKMSGEAITRKLMVGK